MVMVVGTMHNYTTTTSSGPNRLSFWIESRFWKCRTFKNVQKWRPKFTSRRKWKLNIFLWSKKKLKISLDFSKNTNSECIHTQWLFSTEVLFFWMQKTPPSYSTRAWPRYLQPPLKTRQSLYRKNNCIHKCFIFHKTKSFQGYKW